MIDAGNLSTAEVRAQYVLPLMREMAEKAGLVEHAASMGVDVSPAAAAAGDAPAQAAPPAAGVEVRTLFQEIATDCKGVAAGEDARGATVPASPRCYAEMLEEAAALCAYLTPQENAIVATIATSCQLAFLMPQCHFQGFLHSYYNAQPAGAQSSLDERLTNATLSNHNGASGGVFPYSASRMGSLVADDDVFVSSAFHKFLVQGLGPCLSSGLAFAQYSKDEILSASGDVDSGVSCDAVLKQAGSDLVQLLAMAICPNPPEIYAPTSLSMEADKGAGGEQSALESIGRLATSTMPFSFQLSYSDRLQLVRLCAELAIPESEDNDYDADDADDARTEASVAKRYSDSGANSDGERSNTLIGASLRQLRSSLFGFASYDAHSEKDAKVAYDALVNVSVNEGNTATIQAEFQRLLQATLEARSEYLAEALGACLANMITRYNGSREYADGAFVRFALGLLGECINERIRMGMEDAERGSQQLASAKDYTSLLEGSAAKRQKIDGAHSSKRCKPYHLVALLNVAEPLFYFLLNSNNNESATDEEASALNKFVMETKAKSQLMRDIAVLLCYPSSIAVVQAAAQCLALALSYHGKFVADKDNVRHLFRFTRQALVDASGSAERVQALRPLIISACTQSVSYAVSLLSLAIKTRTESNGVAWKLASLIAYARPSVVSERLAELKGSSGFDDLGEIERDELMTRLSCTIASYQSASSEVINELISLTKMIDNHWTLYQIVRCAFVTSNFGFAHHLLNERRVSERCSTQQNFLWLTSLTKLAHAEETLGNKGAVGISESLEALNSCHSTLSSLAAMERNKGREEWSSLPINSSSHQLGQFGFQLEFLRVRIEFLNLCMITRSLCSEIILTGGKGPARSTLHRQNTSRSFAMLKSQCVDLYRLFGLHYCQQTRSVLRTFIALCQLMSDLVDALLAKPSAAEKRPVVLDQQGMSKDCPPKGDSRYPISSLIGQIRTSVLEDIQDRDPLPRVHELLSLLNAVVKCPMPFPRGFFRIKSIPICCVNLSAAPGLLSNEADNAVGSVDLEEICVLPGIPFKLVVSGVVPEAFARSADVGFSQIIAWKRVCYVGQLYEDEEVEEASASGEGNGGEMALDPTMPDTDPSSTALQPSGNFIFPLICDPIMREGFYRVEVMLGCRDVRCGEWVIPAKMLDVRLRVEDYSE